MLTSFVKLQNIAFSERKIQSLYFLLNQENLGMYHNEKKLFLFTSLEILCLNCKYQISSLEVAYIALHFTPGGNAIKAILSLKKDIISNKLLDGALLQFRLLY